MNADLIAAGVSTFSPEAAAFRAGRLMLVEIQRLAKRGGDFGFETTFAGTTYINLIRRLRRQGYSVIAHIHLKHYFLSPVRHCFSSEGEAGVG